MSVKKKNVWHFKTIALSVLITVFFLGGVLFSVFSLQERSDSQASAATLVSDDFESYLLGDWAEGSTYGTWKVQFSGYGTVGIETDPTKVLSERPKASTSSGETHASLVTSLLNFGDIDFSVKAKTVQQLRTSTPNPWETAWVMWDYSDNTHFYYLALKTNGWELGKGDPAYPGAQRFLATGSTPSFAIGTWYDVRIKQQGATMSAYVNGQLLSTYTDTERPYLSGSIGLYNEDSYVHFDNVVINDFAAGSPTPTSTQSATPTVTSDTTAPSITITNPTNGSIVKRGSVVSLQASASDNVGVTKVVFSVNSMAACTDTTAPYSCSWNVPAKRNTPYTITTVAYDAAGNTSTATVTVKSSR